MSLGAISEVEGKDQPRLSASERRATDPSRRNVERDFWTTLSNL